MIDSWALTVTGKGGYMAGKRILWLHSLITTAQNLASNDISSQDRSACPWDNVTQCFYSGREWVSSNFIYINAQAG